MRTARRLERGEGKVGCIVSLVVLLIAGALAFKILPVYYANNQLVDAAEELGTRASVLTAENIEKQLRAKAKDLELPEALDRGAIGVTKTGQTEGSCSIRLRYTRPVDLYGITTFSISVDKVIVKQFATY